MSQQETNLARKKALKRSDQFVQTGQRWVEELSKNPRALVGVVLIGVALSGAAIGFLEYRDSRRADAREAHYLAQNSLDEDRKSYVKANFADKKKKPEKKGENAVPAEPDLSKLSGKALDVDQAFPQGVAALKKVVDEFGGTRSGYEAAIQLGNLYYDHGQPEKSVEWYQAAVDDAPAEFERGMGYYILAFAFENSKKFEESYGAFEKALFSGKTGMKGDILLGMAHVSEAKNDIERARTNYDKIVKELPNTPYAQTAEIFRAQLQ